MDPNTPYDAKNVKRVFVTPQTVWDRYRWIFIPIRPSFCTCWTVVLPKKSMQNLSPFRKYGQFTYVEVRYGNRYQPRLPPASRSKSMIWTWFLIVHITSLIHWQPVCYRGIDQSTNRPTDRPTDRPTNWLTNHQKKKKFIFFYFFLFF